MSESLFRLESDLATLLDLREQIAAEYEAAVRDPSVASEMRTELLRASEATEVSIEEHIRRELAKVDGVRAVWKWLENSVAVAKAEAETQTRRARTAQGNLDRLKAYIQTTMEMMSWRDGKPKKLEGKTGAIYLKGNGGKQAVTITDPALVPEEYQRYTVQVMGPVWDEIWRTMGPEWMKQNVGTVVREPALSLIGADIEAKGVPGARLEPRGQHVEIR